MPYGFMRMARDGLLSQKRFFEARWMGEDYALTIVSEWPTDLLKTKYIDDWLDLGEFEAVLDRKFGI